jgi:hypothetical protein
VSRFLADVLGVLGNSGKRSQFVRELLGPGELTREMRNTLLFLVLLGSALLWAVGATVLGLAFPVLVAPWNAALLVYFHALTTNLFNPVPVEPTVLGASLVVGPVGAVAAGSFGKMVGAWVIFTLGPVLRKAAMKLESRSPKVTRFMERAEGFARRFGYVALGLMLAVPGSPFDIVPVYLFSVMGLKLAPFLAAVFFGYVVRLGLVVLLGVVLFG